MHYKYDKLKILSLLYFLTIYFASFSFGFAQLSPGDLHKSHTHLEGLENCTSCHESGKQLNPDNCLSCHTLLKERIENNKGLHANKEFRQCETCHVDHLGENYEMIYWEGEKENFDHNKAGYKLEGKHKELECSKCHNPKNIVDPQRLQDKKKDLKKTFLGLGTDCLSCHHDEHRGQLKTECLTCHTMEGWKPAPDFDHNKTNYKLTGKHKDVKCEKCHNPVTDNKFEDDNSYLKFSPLKFNSCINCHKDVHKNKFGPNCTECHNTSGWSNYSQKNFDHSKTKYPLKGLHKSLRCEQCHKPGKPLKIKRFNQCKDCHFDTHQNQFASRPQKGACEECHTVNGFLPSTFTTAMHEECDYPLKGSHLAVPCFACHKKIAFSSRREKITQFSFNSTRCADCHVDVHQGQTRAVSSKNSNVKEKDNCEFCHQVESWSAISFEHSKTKFALDGRHESTDCVLCHKQKGQLPETWHFKDVQMACESCHADQHQGQLADNSGKTDCAKCHTSTDWFAENFDHEKHAKFSLKGGHQFVSCKECHKAESKDGIIFVRYKPLETKCESCHLDNNPKKLNRNRTN